MENHILITSIQRFSLHDGPGIRTTVFLKGCTLRCPWCSNPENLKAMPEPYCKDGQEGIYGRWISSDDLFRELMKDQIFFEKIPKVLGAYQGMPGGVTFSGGEPLLQIAHMKPLLQRLRNSGVHLCSETSLFVPKDALCIALEYMDLFYVDIKILDENCCRKILGGDLNLYFSNLQMLLEKKRPFVFRVPVIGGYTDDQENRRAVIELIRKFRPIKIELIKEHNLGESKYHSLGRKSLVLNRVTDSAMDRYRQEIVSLLGVEVEICQV